MLLNIWMIQSMVFCVSSAVHYTATAVPDGHRFASSKDDGKPLVLHLGEGILSSLITCCALVVITAMYSLVAPPVFPDYR